MNKREKPASTQQPGVRSVYEQVCVYSASALVGKWVCLCALADSVCSFLNV